METCIASYNKKQKDELFRIYVTDGLFALVNGSTYKSRYVDLVEAMEGTKKKEEKPQNADSVKAQIKAKIRGGLA